ncbi:MAG: AmmeMemoRadiSam system radical SAM enzyme [Oscillospiraceae bacterium]|nr:AmmeMemoRadiSam system radical SAM enzyme [Oscillospiraceae bacterium]
MSESKVVCEVCPHHCAIPEGGKGKCRARGTRDGKNVPLLYGVMSSVALDPIEKKPLRRFYLGSFILSVGSFGCNLNCPFCQNWEISMSDGSEVLRDKASHTLAPDVLADMAEILRGRGNIGVAFTYNEPTICHEYILDTAPLLREKGLKTVLVTNGCAEDEITARLLPHVDALNIDLKSFDAEVYRKTLGGDLETVKRFIEKASTQCHVELTTLIVPGLNDSEAEMRSLTDWVASLPDGEEIPLHITRFFPRYRMTDRAATERRTVLRLTEIAGEKLKYVYPGNM